MSDLLGPSAERIHVLQVVGNAIVGGMENGVLRLVERLPRDRFAISVIAPFESLFTERLRELGAEVFVTTVTEEPSWPSIQLTCALVRARGVDVLHAHLPNAHVLAALAGKLTGRPVLATIHGLAATPLDIEVQRAASTHLGVVCRASSFHALGVGIDPGHVHFIPNGVDTDRFRPLKVRDGALRSRFGIEADALVVGFVGRLSHEKGPEVFLRMALSVGSSRPGTRFVMVGEGPMLSELEAYVERFGLSESVHFAGMQDDMAAVLHEFDVAVSSSHSEAMPFAVMEAMSSGLPVVACKVGGVADLVQHGITGWIANEGDHDGLATRVVDLLDDAALRTRTGLAARERACSRFGVAGSVDATARLLARLSQERRVDARRGSLHEAARPLRASGGTMKPAARAG